MDFESLFESIPALREFQAEPVPAKTSGTMHVRRFLVERHGSAWMLAGIAQFALPAGQTAYVALLFSLGGVHVHMALEAADGTLTTGQPIAQEQQEESEPEQEQEATSNADELPEQECLEGIIPALMQIRKALGETKMKKRKRRYLVGQLEHAMEHLLRQGVHEK